MTAALCLAATVVLVLAEHTGPDALRGIAKTTASLAFFAQGFHSGAPPVVLLVALGASVVGDVCLLHKPWFKQGIVAFGVAHLAFCAAFLAIGISVPATGVALVLVGALGLGVTRTLADRVGSLRRAVEGYALLLCTMTSLAVGSFAADPSASRGALLASAVVFLGSDLFVARNRFVARAWLNRAIGLPMYYGAQLVFATVFPELLR